MNVTNVMNVMNEPHSISQKTLYLSRKHDNSLFCYMLSL